MGRRMKIAAGFLAAVLAAGTCTVPAGAVETTVQEGSALLQEEAETTGKEETEEIAPVPDEIPGAAVESSELCPDDPEPCPDTSELCQDASELCQDASELCPDASGLCSGNENSSDADVEVPIEEPALEIKVAEGAAKTLSKTAASDAETAESGGEWKEVTEDVEHKEEGHYEKVRTGEKVVVDQEPWDEYIEHYYYECTVCLFRDDTGDLIDDHVLSEHPTGDGQHYYDPVDGDEIYPSYRGKYEYETVHHDAETHIEDVYTDVWHVDKEACTEHIPTGRYQYFLDGKPVTDKFANVDGKTYYFDSDGFPVTGWRTINGWRYYFADEQWAGCKDSNRGKMITGWATISGRVYYFMDSRYKAYSKDKEGSMLSGWKTIKGRRYYFMDSKSSAYKKAYKGSLLTGFRKISGKTYYLTNNRAAGYKNWKRGIAAKGLVTIGGKKYYFSSSGVMARNRIVKIKGSRYYFSKNGTMIKNRWVKIKGKRYYADKKGVLRTKRT